MGMRSLPHNGHEFIHLDEPLPVKLPAYTRIRRIFRITLWKHALLVPDYAQEEAVHLDQTSVDFRPVFRPEFQVFAVVSEAGKDLFKAVDHLLIHRDYGVQVLSAEARFRRFGHSEELRIIGRDSFHIIFQGVQNRFFRNRKPL